MSATGPIKRNGANTVDVSNGVESQKLSGTAEPRMSSGKIAPAADARLSFTHLPKTHNGKENIRSTVPASALTIGARTCWEEEGSRNHRGEAQTTTERQDGTEVVETKYHQEV
eukprot:scaffold7209_cov54-Cyclotella_meneghiniana.AAC.4